MLFRSTQVAKVSKPLASTAEMVDAGNLVIMHKEGGVIKQMNADQAHQVMTMIQRIPGPCVPITRRANVFNVEIDVKEESSEWSKVKASKRANKASAVDKMQVDQVGYGNTVWDAFWNDTEQPFQRHPTVSA